MSTKKSSYNFPEVVFMDGLKVTFEKTVYEPVYGDEQYLFSVWKEDGSMVCAFALDTLPKNRFDIIFGVKKAQVYSRERNRRKSPIKMKKVNNDN